jgi:hypothetical protein
LEESPIVAKYAEAFDVSYEEALQRLELQPEMANLANQVADGEPTYAGSWIQHEPEFRLFVAFATPNGEEKMSKYLEGIEWAELVEITQSAFTIGELKHILNAINRIRDKIDIPFESGTNYQTGKITLYTPNPDELQKEIEEQPSLKQYYDDIEYVHQETMSQPALSYPYLFGGIATQDCTTGFVVKRKSDGRRFMSTAGHCDNDETVDDISLGPVVDEYNPIPDPPIGSDDADFQTHNVAARSWDLTNVIRTGNPGVETTASVVSYQFKGSTQGKWVCKHGRTTSFTCGTVTDINFSPSYAPNSNTYVRVTDYWGILDNMACRGDSGSPVFEEVTGGVSGVGILSGITGDPCSNYDFVYTPVDEIDRFGYVILTTHYPQYFYQNVFWSATNCVEYKVPVDDNGNLDWSNHTTRSCRTFAPGSGSIESYTAYVSGESLHEAIWRGGKGYVRDVPLKSNGKVDWSNPQPDWQQCCTGTGPAAQGAFIVGNHFYQNVFWSATNCEEYRVPLDDNGNPDWSNPIVEACHTFAPGSGSIESYTAYVNDEHLHEAIWRGGKGYVRDVPLNWKHTEVDWRPYFWDQCCTGTGPAAQGAYILTHQ